MAAIYSNGDNRWNILGFNFTKRDALSSLYKISMGLSPYNRPFHRSCAPSSDMSHKVAAIGALRKPSSTRSGEQRPSAL